MSKNPPTPASSHVEETIMLPASSADDETLRTGVSKQERDLAFAVALVHLGKLNERQLARGLADWTVYGTETLGERLVRAELVLQEDVSLVASESDKLLEQTARAIEQSDVARSESQLTVVRISHLDSAGRISKILGLANTAGTVSGQSNKQLFSRFSVIRKLGEGGLGTVWLARDESLRRYVAIKEIRSRNGHDSDAAITRFRREAEVTGRLEHPGIVPIYQFGTDSESGRYFYAMRFLGKQTMQDAITEYHERREAGNDEPLLMHRLLTSFVKLCDSVAHAHSRQVVHRDLKPENVALDSFGQVVLLDWGLAKINDETGAIDAALDIQSGGGSEESHTLASQVLGSPMYMAPEQAAGRIDEIDERTDVYGLGGILFAILTGMAPHEKSIDDRDSSSVSDLLTAIVSGPSVRAKDMVANVPPELDAICAKATEKKRYLRYRSASAIAEDVERYMAGDNVTAYAEPSSKKVKRWIAAHPRLSQVFGLVASLAILTILVFGYSFRQTQIAQANFRFQRAVDAAKELSFHLQSQADHVIRDARFLNGLPPVQAIIATRHVDSQGTETEETWRGRLSVISEGLLNRNESYVSVAFVALGQDVEPITKSDRNPGDGTVRRVPRSQLKRFPAQEDGPDFTSMLPGDVILLSSDQISEGGPTRFRDVLTLAAINSVFDDETGELFGLMAIQLDLRKMVGERLEAIGGDAANVYITDGRGAIQMAYSGGKVVSHHENESIGKLFPQLVSLFTEGASQESYSDGHSTYAFRLRLGERSAISKAELGVIVEVPQS